MLEPALKGRRTVRAQLVDGVRAGPRLGRDLLHRAVAPPSANRRPSRRLFYAIRMGCCQGKKAEGELDDKNPENNGVAANPIHDAAGPKESEAEVEAKLRNQFGGSFRRPSVEQGVNAVRASR